MAKVIVCGSRTYNDWEIANENIRLFTRHLSDVTIISGCCSDEKNGVLTFTRKDGTKVYGADGLGERYAEENNIPIIYCPADWKKYGKAAGPIRNKEMGEIGTHCMAFYEGLFPTKGTQSMINIARSKKLIVEQIGKVDSFPFV